jgi:glycosyltransferase involved in cell wall biosynthesis
MTLMVSVVITTYNRAVYVVKAIESVLGQNYKNYEIIVVDDGSIDNTRESLTPYCQSIRYFYQENQGVSAARNKGIDLAKGEWVAFLDDDDEWFPTKLERQIEALVSFGKDFDVCFTNCQMTGNSDMQQTVFQQGMLEEQTLFGFLDDPVPYILAQHPVILLPSLLVRKSLLKELNGFDEAMTVSEDTDLMLRLALKSKFCFVSESLVKIDRAPFRRGLMDLLLQANDKAFDSRAHMFRKWIKLPDMVDQKIQAKLHEDLRSLYLDWMIRKLYTLEFSKAFAKLKQAREVKYNYWEILSELSFRAARKIYYILNR